MCITVYKLNPSLRKKHINVVKHLNVLSTISNQLRSLDNSQEKEEEKKKKMYLSSQEPVLRCCEPGGWLGTDPWAGILDGTRGPDKRSASMCFTTI